MAKAARRFARLEAALRNDARTTTGPGRVSPGCVSPD
jgi:hypothetical protein